MLLIALLQAPAAQDVHIEDRIAAYLKGDDAARTELLKLGVFAIRPLQKARDKGAQKIDALVLELKKAAMHPKDSEVWRKIESKVTVPETPVRLLAQLPQLVSRKK